MNTALPSRFRHPIHDPDPALAEQYQSLFARHVSPPLPSQVELVRAALMRGDPLADAWLVRARTLPAGDAARLFERALNDGIERVDDAPPELLALFRPLESVPLWLDVERLKLGAIVSRRAGLLGHFVLSDFGLLGGYRSAAVAKTLISTGKLRDSAAERLIYTGRYVTAVTEPGAMLPGQSGYRATIRVRMVHAHVRHGLLQSSGWQTERWGVPVNQADTLSTNLLFSIGFLEGCRKWGLRFTDREADAVIHLWRYIGSLIGIDEALLPSDVDSARRALYMVGVSQPDPDQDSVELARALRQVPLSFAHTPLAKRIVSVEMGLRLSMSRRILGDRAVDQLGLPKSRLRVLLPPLVGVISAVDRARTVLPFGDYVAYKVGNYLIEKGEAVLDAELQRRKSASTRAGAPASHTPQVPPDVPLSPTEKAHPHVAAAR